MFCCKKGVIFKPENKVGYHVSLEMREPGVIILVRDTHIVKCSVFINTTIWYSILFTHMCGMKKIVSSEGELLKHFVFYIQTLLSVKWSSTMCHSKSINMPTYRTLKTFYMPFSYITYCHTVQQWCKSMIKCHLDDLSKA